MVIIRTVDGVRSHFLERLPEWLLTSILLSFGFSLIGPGDSFASSRSFDLMASYAPDWAWGVFMLLVGFVRLFALTMNGTFSWFRRWSPGARCVAAVLSLLPWATLWAGILFSNSSSPGWKTYFCLFVGDVIVAIVVAREAGRNERKFRGGT